MKYLIYFIFLMFPLIANAQTKKECLLSNGSRFALVGRRFSSDDIGPHRIQPSGKVPDAFLYGYSVKYRIKGGGVTPIDWFTDFEPKCENYGVTDNGVIYVIATYAKPRFYDGEGQKNIRVLITSHDNGKTFGENVYPFIDVPNDGRLDNFDSSVKFYGDVKFDIKNEKYQMESAHYPEFEKFKFTTSDDRGKNWSKPQISTEPKLFSAEEVLKKRNAFFDNRWSFKVYFANQSICQKNHKSYCNSKTQEHWDTTWKECRYKSSAQECFARFPEITSME
jgi:hypothetical protein